MNLQGMGPLKDVALASLTHPDRCKRCYEWIVGVWYY